MATLPARRRVIIVGAGMAGLSAATELQRSGLCDVIVLEATERPGGRIHTVKGFASEVIEFGANWLHGTKGNPIYELAAKHGLMSDPEEATATSGSDELRASWIENGEQADNNYQMEKGERVDPKLAAEAKSIYAGLMESTEETSSEPIAWDAEQSLGHFMSAGYAAALKQRGVQDQDPRKLHQFWLMFEHCCRMEALDLGCDALRDVQLRSYGYYEVLDGDYYTTLGDKGYGGVIEKLLEGIPATSVHYDAPVTQISYVCEGDDDDDSGAVRVKCEYGRTFSGSHVIVTTSVGFLKDNLETLFEPALPTDVAETLRTLQFGTVNKMFLKYNKPFWTSEDFGVQTLWEPPLPGEDEEAEKEKFYRMLPGFDAEDKNEDVLMGWTFGKGAEYMETLSDEEIAQRCTAILRKFLGNPSIPEPDKVLCTRWHSNKYQRGAYGAFLPRHAKGTEYETINTPIYRSRPEGGEKVPILLFAGEAYSKEYHSTSHGAMISGQDKARLLIDFMSKQQAE